MTDAAPLPALTLPVDAQMLAALHGEACIECGATDGPLIPAGHRTTIGSDNAHLSWAVVSCPTHPQKADTMNEPEAGLLPRRNPDTCAVHEAGLRLTRALETVGVHLKQLTVLTAPLRIRAQAGIEDIDTLATYVEKNTGQPVTETTQGKGAHRAHGAALRLMLALLGAPRIDLSAKAMTPTDSNGNPVGDPMVRILAAPGETDKLAALIEEHAR